MKVCIAGGGKVGMYLAQSLLAHHHKVTIIEPQEMLCRSLAGLAYLEGGRKTDWFSAYLRGTIFIVDNWDDRIYSYERDAPGNFTVPAYYGRGWSLSAVSGCKLRLGRGRALKLYFRASTMAYSFMKEPKPSVSEAKAQAVVMF